MSNGTVVVTGASSGIGREIADAVLYLTRAEFTTAVVLPVDGGMAAGRF